MTKTRSGDTHSFFLLFLSIVVVLPALFQPVLVAGAESETGKKQQAEDSPSDEKGLQPEALTDIEMVFVKGGCFEMGDVFREGPDDERPVHEVCVDDFYMGRYEVTQKQWKAVIGTNPSGFRDCGSNCPVENVTWDEVQGFIEKLRDKTGKRYRLPTEAEWEYAARSGGKGAKWSGINDGTALADYAWFVANADRKTHPVGQKGPNSLGIHDMSGNVSEWVLDRYDATYYRQSPKENPRGPDSGSYRVLRGGSFYDNARHIRTTSRDEYPQSYRISCVGFRLVMVP